MTQMIAVCEFEAKEDTKSYEYLCDIPEGTNLDELKYAVTLRQACAADAALVKTKRLLSRLQVVYVREFKSLAQQDYIGDLHRLVLVFGLSDFVEHAVRRQKISTLKANLERRLQDMSIFDKIKSLRAS